MDPLDSGDPERIGRYRLIGQLGAGGMGQVFFGRSAAGRAVAVKRIHPHLATDQSFRQRFAREVTAARQVSGAFTAPVIDADPEATVPWLVTSYVPSLPLDEAVRTHGPLPEASLRVLAASLAEALTEIHRVGLIHRDLKPANVLLSEDGPRVIDFGIARATEGTAATQSIIGTPGFMSPEQIQGAPLTPKSDMFAYGAVLVHAAGGIGPFGEGSMPTMVMRILQHEPDLSSVPPSLRQLVAACLAKDERHRPSPGDVLDALGDVPAGNSWLPPPFMRGIQEQVAKVNAALSTTTPAAGTHAATEVLSDHQATRAITGNQPGAYSGPQEATSVMGMGSGQTGPAQDTGYGQATGYGQTGGHTPPTTAMPTGGHAAPTAALPHTGQHPGYPAQPPHTGQPPQDGGFDDLYRGSRPTQDPREQEELRRREEQHRMEEQRRAQEEERRRYEEQRRRERERYEEQRRQQEAERVHQERMRAERAAARRAHHRAHADQPGLWSFVKLLPLLIIPIIQIPLGWGASIAWEWFATTDLYTGAGWHYPGLMDGGFYQALFLGYFLLNNMVSLEYLVRSLRTGFVTGMMLALAALLSTNCALWYFGFFS